MRIKRIFLTVAVAVSMTFFAGCDSSSDKTTKDSFSDSSANVQAETQSPIISKTDAYNLAKAYVPQSILNSAIIGDATHYDITDYEYLGFEEGENDSESHYDFKFYGTWSKSDHYGKLVDDGKFYVTIKVPADGGNFFAMAYLG